MSNFVFSIGRLEAFLNVLLIQVSDSCAAIFLDSRRKVIVFEHLLCMIVEEGAALDFGNKLFVKSYAKLKWL